MRLSARFSIGGESSTTNLYSLVASRIRFGMYSDESRSAGFGGMGPQNRTDKPSAGDCHTTFRQSEFPVRKSTSPEELSTPKKSCRLGRRKSASIRSTDSPSWASESARLAATVVLPSPDWALVTKSDEGGRFAVESSTEVRRPWNASASGALEPLPSIRFQWPLPFEGPFPFSPVSIRARS